MSFQTETSTFIAPHVSVPSIYCSIQVSFAKKPAKCYVDTRKKLYADPAFSRGSTSFRGN